MNARTLFLRMMHERRQFSKVSPDWQWRTAAARKYVWLMRGVPTSQWEDAA